MKLSPRRFADAVVVSPVGRIDQSSADTFMEALAPVPLDHVPDKSLDLVLGPDGGSQHVEH